MGPPGRVKSSSVAIDVSEMTFILLGQRENRHILMFTIIISLTTEPDLCRNKFRLIQTGDTTPHLFKDEIDSVIGTARDKNPNDIKIITETGRLIVQS